MARVESPLFGVSASGVFADVLGFRSKSGIPCVGAKPGRRVFRSPEVIKQQAWYKAACAQWSGFSASTKAEYSRLAPVGQNGFQFFLSSAAVSNVSLGVSAPLVSPWFPCFDCENVGLLSGFCYLLPGFASGFLVFLPVSLDGIARIRSVDYESFPVVSEGCSFLVYFAVNDSVLSCPGVGAFVLASGENLLSALGVGSSGSGRVLWVRCDFFQDV